MSQIGLKICQRKKKVKSIQLISERVLSLYKIKLRMAAKMAAAELKHGNVSCYESVKRNVSEITLHREIECHQFRLLDLFYYLTSVSFFFIDVATDNIVFMEYFLQGQFIWGCFALSFTILPAGIIQMFSLRWYHSDGSIKNIHWLLHFLFLGVLHRYLVLLYATIYSLRSKRFVKDKNWVYRQESDICMLHLFESFMGAAPQLILQLYIMAVLRRTPLWTSLSAIVSFCSLSWAVGTYTKAMHKINPGYNEGTWIILTLQGLWRAGMLISRITVLVLTVICLKEWSLLFFGLHWLFMIIWVILQNTDFCSTIWEERIYNCIIGFIYCFDFFNLRVGKSRYRVLIFYSIIVTENIVLLVVYALCFKDVIKGGEIMVMSSLIIGGMVIGLSSMLFYYGKFHPSKNAGTPDGTDKRSAIVTNKAVTPRSFKQRYPTSFASSTCSIDHSQGTTSDEITTDKQFLLTSIVQNAECTENGIMNQSCKTEDESQTAVCIVYECESARTKFSKDESSSPTNVLKNGLSVAEECVEVQCECNDSTDNGIHRQKRRGICLPMPHDELDIDKNVSMKDSHTSLPLQKRRGICFSNQLILEMEKDTQAKITKDRSSMLDVSSMHHELEKCSPGKVQNDLNGIMTLRGKLKTPTIFDKSCEKIVSESTEKLTKDLHQRDETMSCATSIHDYENVCPLGVARPPWCIRSWKGYTDIETYIHDDSVVRDRRRDTLTSTTTGTTYSSEFSDTTCTSSILMGILKQDDYLDTLTYDLVDSRELKTVYTRDMSVKRDTNADEQNSTLYIAKPVVIDEKGGMTALDTIMEEHDEISTDEKFEYGRSVCDSVSTLVSTIDQIRKYTAENSPRHVYHTTGSQWEDFDPKKLIKNAQLTRALFESDLKESTANNRKHINRLDESQSVVRGKCEIDAIKDLVKYCTLESIKKTPLIDAILSDSPVLGNKAKLQKQISVAYRENESDSKETDLYVEMSPLVAVENVSLVYNVPSKDLSSNTMNASVADPKQLCIMPQISTQSTMKSSIEDAEKFELSSDNYGKSINYPKRKFSLLKQKFESKSQLVYVVTPTNLVKIGQSATSLETNASKKGGSVTLKKCSDSTRQDKENLAPIASCKVDDGTHTSTDGSRAIRENTELAAENGRPFCDNDLNLKERRHMFLEQVLSPPKLLTWTKRKSFGGSAARKT